MRATSRACCASAGTWRRWRDGEAALAAARRAPPDLVLSDVMMPRARRLWAPAALRGNPAHPRSRSSCSRRAPARRPVDGPRRGRRRLSGQAVLGARADGPGRDAPAAHQLARRRGDRAGAPARAVHERPRHRGDSEGARPRLRAGQPAGAADFRPLAGGREAKREAVAELAPQGTIGHIMDTVYRTGTPYAAQGRRSSSSIDTTTAS